MSSTVRLRCHTPSKQYGGKKFGAGSVARIYVQADSITAVYSDLKVGTFKWSPRSPNNRLKADKLKSLPNRGVSNSRSVIKRGSAAPQTMNDSSSRLAVGDPQPCPNRTSLAAVDHPTAHQGQRSSLSAHRYAVACLFSAALPGMAFHAAAVPVRLMVDHLLDHQHCYPGRCGFCRPGRYRL